MIRRPRRSPLFPYTTLSRSVSGTRQGQSRYGQGTAEGCMTTAAIPRPEPSEYAPYYETYLSKVPKGDLLTLLEDQRRETQQLLDRKSTRLNSSHVRISYAVF